MDSYGSEDAWQQQFLHFYAGQGATRAGDRHRIALTGATAADALKLKEWLGDSRGAGRHVDIVLTLQSTMQAWKAWKGRRDSESQNAVECDEPLWCRTFTFRGCADGVAERKQVGASNACVKEVTVNMWLVDFLELWAVSHLVGPAVDRLSAALDAAAAAGLPDEALQFALARYGLRDFCQDPAVAEAWYLREDACTTRSCHKEAIKQSSWVEMFTGPDGRRRSSRGEAQLKPSSKLRDEFRRG